MVVPVAIAAGGVASKVPPPSNSNGVVYLLGGLALVWLVKQGIIDPFNEIKDVAGNFGSGFFNQSRYGYAEDQSGSPNPPPITWWEEVQDGGPMPVNAGSILSVPTPPVMTVAPMTEARDAGKATNRWFTNPKYYPWFFFAEKTVELASEKTNADYYNVE